MHANVLCVVLYRTSGVPAGTPSSRVRCHAMHGVEHRTGSIAVPPEMREAQQLQLKQGMESGIQRDIRPRRKQDEPQRKKTHHTKSDPHPNHTKRETHCEDRIASERVKCRAKGALALGREADMHQEGEQMPRVRKVAGAGRCCSFSSS